VITADDVYARAVVDHGEDRVGAYELAFTYEAMQSMDGRKRNGVFYTPAEVASAMSRFSLDWGLGQAGGEPGDVLRIIALDPACGCGQFLVEAARHLSIEYARRLVGADPTGDLVLAVMPRIILECVFGMDIDPVAVELARRALCLETAGALTPVTLDRHVVAKDALAGPDGPPAFEDRRRLGLGPGS
jgi:hypothetical protein